MKPSFLFFFFIVCLFATCGPATAQDTTAVHQDSVVLKADTSRTFLKKVQGFYNRQYYRFYGRFVSNTIRYDTNYIRKYPEYMVLSVGLGYPYLSYHISPPGGVGSTDYQANIASLLGFKFGYKNIGFGFSFKFKSTLENEKYLTSTSYTAFNFKIQTNRFNHAFAISATQGLTDVSSDQKELTGVEGYVKRDDIIIYNMSYDFIWNLHWKKYSYVAPRTYSQHQIKSMAGFLLKSGIVLNEFRADSFIINPAQRRNYRGFSDINHFSGIALELAPGIGGNLVISKGVYFSNLLFIGMDYYTYAYKHTGYDESYRSSSTQFFFDIETNIGYQSERAFIGLHVEWKGFYTQIKDASMLWYNAYAGINAGYRIRAPKLFKKGYTILFPY